MSRILITGGAGFIGSWLAERLQADHELVLYDSLRRDALRHAPAGRWRLVQGDVLDPEGLAAAAAGCDTIIHLAAVAGVSAYSRNPVETLTVNILGTRNVLEVARTAGATHLITLSSSEVYGPHASGVTEADPAVIPSPEEPRWSYAASKVAGEHLAFAYARQHGLAVTVLRPFNVYGPRQVGEGAISLFLEAIRDGRPITVRGGGEQVRAWCFVSDFVNAVTRVLERKEARGQVFNIGNPEATVTVRELARRVLAASGATVPVVEQEMDGRAEVVERVPRIEKAAEMLGFQPRIGLDQGLAETARWFLRERQEVAG